jgi:hypothetical protein
MLVESSDDEQIIERVAGLDIGKAEIGVLCPAPGCGGWRRQGAGGVQAFDDGHLVV